MNDFCGIIILKNDTFVRLYAVSGAVCLRDLCARWRVSAKCVYSQSKVIGQQKNLANGFVDRLKKNLMKISRASETISVQ